MSQWIAIALVLQLAACAPSAPQSPLPGTTPGTPLLAATSVPADLTPTATMTPQVTATAAAYGPDLTEFPSNINPLTGEPVVDPALLKIPAVLVSISHFPAAGRPQAGLSFAPFVYDFSITGGESRFLAAFYGEWPKPEVPLDGDCTVRQDPFVQTGSLIAGRVWLDSNRNGRLDVDEQGIPGICVSLLSRNGEQISLTTTDTNGYYGFNVNAGTSYTIRFHRASYLDFTFPNLGDDTSDSDADPISGDTLLFTAVESGLRFDAGLFPNASYEPPTPDSKTAPPAEIGPVRSGRLLYAHIAAYYQNSCLIYAFADPEVLAELPHCAFVAHETAGGGAMLPIDRMKAVAEDNMRHTATHPFNYSSNAYSQLPPPGGFPASELKVFFGNLDQSGWIYDPLYQAYLRFVDTADPKQRGVLHADVDRLTGRQLLFENVIVIMVDTDVISPTILDIHLDEGNTGPAYLFRDGRMYTIQWSTRAGTYERTTGLRRPIQFINPDGTPALLRPGHTWVVIVTPFSPLAHRSPGVYQVTYAPPEGEAR